MRLDQNAMSFLSGLRARVSISPYRPDISFSVLGRPVCQHRVGLAHARLPSSTSQNRLTSSLFTASQTRPTVKTNVWRSCLTSRSQPAVQRRSYQHDPRHKNYHRGPYGHYQQYHQPWHLVLRQRANRIVYFVLTYGFIGSCVYVWWQWREIQGGGGLGGFNVGLPGLSGGSKPWKEYDGNGRQVTGASKGFPDLHDNFMLSERNLEAGRWWTLVSAAASHKSWEHLLFNMLAFQAFMSAGRSVGISALMLGAVGFSSAIGCSQAQIADFQRKGIPGQALGASGLVCGLAGFVTVIAPRLPMMFGMPLWLVTSGLVAWDTYNADNMETNISHAGHLGGTAVGVALGIARRALIRF